MQIISASTPGEAPGYNEAEVRFHVVDPIIRSLGYPGKDDVYLALEEKLEYPYMHIGRRSKKDLPMGFPDYRAGLKGARGSFVVEAKAGSVPITSLEVEQAHSYAAHAQVGANYFVLCNGSVFEVYETLSGPNAAPIVQISLSEINGRFHELENILSPSSLSRNCKIVYDRRLKLVDGLGSSVRIRAGSYFLSDYKYRILMNGQDYTAFFRESVPQLAQIDQQLELIKTAFELRVSGGTAERGEDGRITAHIEFTGATVHNHEAMRMMGITEATFATADKFISTEPDSPSIFESVKNIAVSRGAVMPQFLGGSSIIEGDVVGNIFINAAMYYRHGKIEGRYICLSDQEIYFPGAPPLTLEMDFAGDFDLTVDV